MEKARIQDDLYSYVNQEWLDQAVIPDDRPVTGGFATLDEDVEKLMIGEFKEMAKSGVYPNAHLERAITLYKEISNVKRRNKLGAKPAFKYLKKLEKINNIGALNRNFADMVKGQMPLPFDLDVMTDFKNSSKNVVFLTGPSTFLPDASYYKPEMAQQKQALLGMWANMAKGVMAFSPLSAEDQDKYIKDAMAFDEIVATLVKTALEWSEYTKAYNPMKTRTVASMVKPIKFRNVLAKLFGTVPEMVVVADPRFFKGFKTLFNEQNFELYKHWAYVKVLIEASQYLSEQLRDIGSSFRRALTGVAAMPSVDKYAYDVTSSIYSEPIGVYYGKKYFGEAAKKDITDIVYEIINTYKDRVKRNAFLSDATKEKAILKLDKMGVKMAYPDKIEKYYDNLLINPKDNLLDIVVKLRLVKREKQLEELYTEVDKTKWAMPGHMVNACYMPTVNDITFPAAILQPPFYSYNQSRSANLGGIGAVIGHEISHAFDNNGANIDENGNLNNWWTKQDVKNFKKATKAMIKEFEGIELPWGKVNAELTVSENIADNGGMAVTLEIMSKTKDCSYEDYFMNWARVWCLKAKPEYLQMILNVDVHSPSILRANMQPRNFPEWYDTFKVKKTDKMYIAPNKRVVIW